MSKSETLEQMAQLGVEQNQHLETIAIGITNIADYLGQLLDFISVVNFDELEAREQEMRTAAEKRL
tara:strand:- start:3226 stop:3423 length:198 start_codon:yes stop_codon:yes gene_type:complete